MLEHPQPQPDQGCNGLRRAAYRPLPMLTSFSVLLEGLQLIATADYSQTVPRRYYAIPRAISQDLGENRPEERQLILSADDASIEFYANIHLETPSAYVCHCRIITSRAVSYDQQLNSTRLDSSFLIDAGKPHSLLSKPPAGPARFILYNGIPQLSR